jgi:hypothetical protein
MWMAALLCNDGKLVLVPYIKFELKILLSDVEQMVVSGGIFANFTL